MPDQPDNIVLVELRGLRREFVAMLERQQLFSKQQTQFLDGLTTLSNEVRELRRTIQNIQSDVILLESNNVTRHNEILDALRRIENIEGEELPSIKKSLQETERARSVLDVLERINRENKLSDQERNILGRILGHDPQPKN